MLSNQKRVGFATFAIIATVLIVTRAQVPTPVTSGTKHALAQKLSLGGHEGKWESSWEIVFGSWAAVGVCYSQFWCLAS